MQYRHFTLAPPTGMCFRFWGSDRDIQFCFPPGKEQDAIAYLEQMIGICKQMAVAYEQADKTKLLQVQKQEQTQPVVRPKVLRPVPKPSAIQEAMMPATPPPSRVMPDIIAGEPEPAPVKLVVTQEEQKPEDS